MDDRSALELRHLAGALVARLRELRASALGAGGVDLGPALEQVLYMALRDGLPASRGAHGLVRGAARRLGPLAAAALAVARGGGTPPGMTEARAPVTVVIRQPVHARLFAPVGRALDERGIGPITVVRVGAAAADPGLAGAGPRIEAFLDRTSVRELLRGGLPSAGAIARAWAPVTGDAGADLARHAVAELRTLRIAALALRAALLRTGASVAVTYDEVGRWGRLVASAAAATGASSVDLPHAEAVDAVAMRGIGFDRIAVFGAVAAERVRRAGVAADRIVEIGSPALDALVTRARARTAEPPAERRLVFASQYLGGVMTEQVKRRTVAAALEAAGAAAPCELVLVPHPVERDGLLQRAAEGGGPDGVRLRLAPVGSLHDELLCAWLLVTGSSQSVIEATAVGVPSLTLNLTGGPDPVPYAAEGMALGAASADEAASAVAALRDPAAHDAAVARATASLERHVGPLDAGASGRAAELIAREATRSGRAAGRARRDRMAPGAHRSGRASGEGDPPP